MHRSTLGLFLVVSTLAACAATPASPDDDGSSTSNLDAKTCAVGFKTVELPGLEINGASALVTGDFDADGLTDLLAVRSTSLHVFRGDKSGTPKPLAAADVNHAQGFAGTVGLDTMTTGDFDGDKKLDVLGQATFTAPDGSSVRQLVVLRGKGDGTFEHPTYPMSVSGTIEQNVADFDHDGRSDILVRDKNGAVILYGGADGNFVTEVTSLPKASDDDNQASVGDLDGDGSPEILVFHAKPSVTIYSNAGKAMDFAGAKSRDVGFKDPGAARVADVTDLDGDGKADLMIAGQTLQRFIGSNLDTMPAAAVVTQHVDVVADFDGDKKADALLLAADSTYTLACNVTGKAAPALAKTTLPQEGSRAYGDLDGDGRTDVIVAKMSGVTVYFAGPAKAPDPTGPTPKPSAGDDDDTPTTVPTNTPKPRGDDDDSSSTETGGTVTVQVKKTPAASGCNAAAGSPDATWLFAALAMLSLRRRRSPARG